MTEDPLTAKLDLARKRGASAGDILAALERSGHPNPRQAFKDYANSLLPDGRRRSQVNLGDPAEWD